MNIALHGTAAHVERVCSGYRRARKLYGIDSANDQRQDRELRYQWDDDGSLMLKGRLPAEVGAMVLKALEMATARTEEDVSAETSKRICCDTSISVLKEDEIGEPLSIGRKSRVVPPGMARPLKARDRTCCFPGCTHRHFIDAHHIEHWSKGGETSMENLIRLCRHHRLAHENFLTMG